MTDSRIHSNTLVKPSLPRVLAVVGLTATGKTDLAIELALRFNGEVISADSRQVYRGLDLGTGKVTSAEMRGVPHHMLDVAEPNDRYTVARFQTSALAAIDDILSRGALPIICGGTGMYIDSLLDDAPLPHVPPNPELRATLEGLSAAELYGRLTTLDPQRASTIDQYNPHRIVRAIEIATALGHVPEMPVVKPRFDALIIGLDMNDREVHAKRVHDRISTRIDAGMLEEALRLHTEGMSLSRMRELGLEYRHLAQWIESGAMRDTLSITTFTDLLAADIRAYARRQRTWFKRRAQIEWFDPTEIDVCEKIIERVTEFVRP